MAKFMGEPIPAISKGTTDPLAELQSQEAWARNVEKREAEAAAMARAQAEAIAKRKSERARLLAEYQAAAEARASGVPAHTALRPLRNYTPKGVFK